MAKKSNVVEKYSAGCYACRTYATGLTFEEQQDATLKHIETHPHYYNVVGAEGVGNFVTEKFRVVSLDEFLKA